MESDVVRQRTRVEDQTEKNEKTEKRERRSKERMSVREPVLETRHYWHRKRTWMPLFDVWDQVSPSGEGEESKGKYLKKLPRKWKTDFLEDSQFDSGLVG